MQEPRGARNSSTSRNDSGVNKSNSSSNRSASVNRSSNTSQNSSNQSRGKANTSGKSQLQEPETRPRTLPKQGTFIKESTNKNAPVISPSDKSKGIASSNGVKMRQKKPSESSQTNRNSSGSSKSNFSNTSNNSFSTSSSDSPPDSWAKTLNSYNFRAEQDAKRKGSSSVRRNLLQDVQATKIPSPSRSGINKSGSGQNLRKADKVVKSSSGSSLKHTGSSNSLKQNGSRPTTPVVMSNRKGSNGSITNNKSEKKTEKKTVTSKIVGLWKSENKKNKPDKKSVSKLPVAKGKGKNKKEDKKHEKEEKDTSSRQNVNRNTYILSESTVDGITKSSTYDKLNSTNDISQVPNHDSMKRSGSEMTRSGGSSGFNSADVSKAKPIFDDSELNKTCRDISVFEIGVEYDLEDAWASNIEKSIASMSRSIEENKNKVDKSSFYDEYVDTSKMDLTNSPANRLSKSGSMSEIEQEFGRGHSGTWTKKKSQNDFTRLPNADETSRTLPLVKRSESLNFPSHLGVTHLDFDDGEEVWIRRDDPLRASDITMSKKKKGFKGSSGFLNVVSKMFGGSKKVSDKQSKSFVADPKAKKEKDSKMNKSEFKASKAEAKMNKSLQKALKKEAKLSKSSKKSVDNDDGRSSTSSMKKSAEDLIDIDRSDEDEVFSCHSSNHAGSVPHTPEMKKSFTIHHNSHSTPGNPTAATKLNSHVPSSINNVHSTSAKTNQSFDSAHSDSGSDCSPSNSSCKSSPGVHFTKTEMLLARRQRQLSGSSSLDQSLEGDHEDGTGKRKCIITTV